MALVLSQAARLKPEIRLGQALSEYETVLDNDQKAKLRTYRAQSPPNATDVMRLTAEIDQDAARTRKSRQCVGPRLTNFLQAVQAFSSVIDVGVGGAQSPIASGIWAVVKMSLQVVSTISNYFDQLSTLFMTIGRSCPRNQEYMLLYPRSQRLQEALFEYFIIVVRLCKHAVIYLDKSFLAQLSTSIWKPFESEFGGFRDELEKLANTIRDEASLASKRVQEEEAKENQTSRVLLSRSSAQMRRWRRQKITSDFLNACSPYNHRTAWKQARRHGNVAWFRHEEAYRKWKSEPVSGVLWCSGNIGSGKTVLMANVVDDLVLSAPKAVCAYFFCRYDDAKSLSLRTIVGSIARQILQQIKNDTPKDMSRRDTDLLDVDMILEILLAAVRSRSEQYYIIIDGIDECDETENRRLMNCLKSLMTSLHAFKVILASRPDVFNWASTILEPHYKIIISASNTDTEIARFVESALESRLCLGDQTIRPKIQSTLLANAHGMFLWVTFQIDSICSQPTDQDILNALEDLPKDLPQTFNRILRKMQDSRESDASKGLVIAMFNVVAAAQRPLTLSEHREAISVEPGETKWNSKNLVNKITRLVECCGSLLVVDEEMLTVQFTHYSIRQFLCSGLLDISLKKYQIDLVSADLVMGKICVTYLDFEHFSMQLSSTRDTRPIKTSEILRASIPDASPMSKLVLRYLTSRSASERDIRRPLENLAGLASEPAQEDYLLRHFLTYAKDFWLLHTRTIKRSTCEEIWSSWMRLATGKVHMVQLPWTTSDFFELKASLMDWISQHRHWELCSMAIALAKQPVPTIWKNSILKTVTFDHTCSLGELLELFNEDYVRLQGEFDTALQIASCRRYLSIAQLLLDYGSDVNLQTGYFGNAIQAAASAGDTNTEIVKLLLKHGADVNAQGGVHGNPLRAAASAHLDSPEVVRFLLEHGADVNAQDGHYSSALHAASINGNQETVKLLLEHGADVNAQGGPYSSALYAALGKGNQETAKLLLEHGADVNAQGGPYGSALHSASGKGNQETAKLLLEHGADVNAQGGPYGSALHAASINGNQETVKLLLEHGADVNAQGGPYGSALHAASSQGNQKTVELLLEHGADINAQGGPYGSALHAALGKGNQETVKLLLEYGAVDAKPKKR